MIDLRSDTVTLPSAAMSEAIATAELGDDVYREDPTVNRLEELAAEKVGKEAALLVPSGTMGNLLSLLAHCERGQRILIGSESHIYVYEAGGASALGGIAYQPVPNLADGTLDMTALAQVITNHDRYDPHFAPIGLVCLENTHNRCGGAVLTAEYMARVQTLAHEYDMLLHLDGARIFNAAVALGCDVRTLTQHVDTVQFCLSKGLAAPVGSLIAGPQPFVDRARRLRRMLGGGMRQAGIIAAAGIVALTEMVDRLQDDHDNALALAQGLSTLPGIAIDMARVQTNIVIFTLTDERVTPQQFEAALQERGVLVGGMGGRTIRAVTHYGIERAHIEQALVIISESVMRNA